MPVRPTVAMLVLLPVIGRDPVTAQDAAGRAAVAALIDAFADEDQRPLARERLLALGAAAVPAIAARLGTANDDLAPRLLSLLVELGPAAADALPQVIDLLGTTTVPVRVVFDTIAELAPWRAAGATATVQSVMQLSMRRLVDAMDGADFADDVRAHERVGLRFRFSRDAGVAALVDDLRGTSAVRVEFACDVLRARGAAAAAALPALRAVLDRPEPRVLGTTRTLPVHTKAARAILAITATGDHADLARDVLAGRRAPPVAAERPVPERLARRITELLAELRVPATRAAAAANLVALGAAAAGPVGAQLLARPEAETLDALLAVLRALGPAAAGAAAPLYDALATLSIDQATTALAVLTDVAAFVPDVVPLPAYTIDRRGVTLRGAKLTGSTEPAALDGFHAAIDRLAAHLRVPPGGDDAELAELLGHSSVEMREVALAAIAARGPASRALLPALAEMLSRPQPRSTRVDWTDVRGARVRDVDRTGEVQRLAARAMLAAGAADDPLLAHAREVLARPLPAK